jgi:hypothetical protein
MEKKKVGIEVDNSLYQWCAIILKWWKMIEMLNQKVAKIISIHDSSNVAKNIEGCFKILVSYLASSQIWLNLPVDHCHFGYSTKLPKTKKKKHFHSL